MDAAPVERASLGLFLFTPAPVDDPDYIVRGDALTQVSPRWWRLQLIAKAKSISRGRSPLSAISLLITGGSRSTRRFGSSTPADASRSTAQRQHLSAGSRSTSALPPSPPPPLHPYAVGGLGSGTLAGPAWRRQ